MSAPQASVDQEETVGWNQLLPILVVHLCGTLGFSIALPILVFLIQDLGGATWAYGLLGATYSTAQMFGAPLLGRWSDRSSRKAVLVASQAGTAAAWLLFLLALQLPRDTDLGLAGLSVTLPLVLVFGARFLDGLTGGNISVANAYVADLTRNAKAARQAAYGRMGMAASVGFTSGPALAGLLAKDQDPYTGPIVAALAISLVGILLCLRLKDPKGRCPEGPPPQGALSRAWSQQQRRCDKTAAKSSSGPSPWRGGTTRVALGMNFLLFLGFNIFYAAFPVHATSELGWRPSQMGLFYSSLSVVMFLTQGPLLGAVSKHRPGATVFAGGLAVLILAFVVFPGSSGTAAYLGGALFALGNGLAWPTFQAQTADLVPAEDQGSLQGALSSAGALASIAGLTLGGTLYPLLGGKVFWLSSLLFLAVVAQRRRLF